MWLKQQFFPAGEPTAAQMERSRRVMLAQGGLAAVMLALGTGNFLAGYLSFLGAKPSVTAQIMAIPMLGCVLQMVAPFFFERLRHRKLAVVLLCFFFRFSMGFAVFAPLLFTAQSSQIRFVFVLYMVSFLTAGFVTPALNQWVLQIAPTEGRGRYFAVKEILSSCLNAGVAFVMGRQLDAFTAQGKALTGYLVVYVFCIAFSLVDALLMCIMKEPASVPMETVRLADILTPIRDKTFRPVFVYTVMNYFAGSFSSGFLAVYQLRFLGLNHTFITTVGMVSAVVGMVGTWVWGRIADKTYWSAVALATECIALLCNLGWFFITPTAAPWVAPVLMALSASGGAASGTAGMNMQYDACGEQGKTTYLGVTAAIASLVGYGAAMLGAGLQSALEPALGAQSISLLFLASAAVMLCAVLFGAKYLPRKQREEVS